MNAESLGYIQFHSDKSTGAGDHFSLQEGGLPDPRILPDPKIKHRSLAVSELQADSSLLSHLGSPHLGPVNITTLDDDVRTLKSKTVLSLLRVVSARACRDNSTCKMLS